MTWSERARALLQNVWTHHQEELMRLERARMAKAANLDPDNYAMPYPSNQHISIQHTNSGLWKGALLGAALLSGGGIGALGVASSLGLLSGFFPDQSAAPQAASPSPVPPVTPSLTPIEQPAAPVIKPQRFRITIRAADGTPLATEEVSAEGGVQ